MKYTLKKEHCTDLQNEYEVQLSAEEVQEKLDSIYGFLAMQTGVDIMNNSPRDGLKKRYGDKLNEEIANCLANQCADKIIAEEGLSAALEPTFLGIGAFKEDEEFTFLADIHLKPILELTSYGAIDLPAAENQASDQDVECYIQRILKDKAKFVSDKKCERAQDSAVVIIKMDTKKCGMQVNALTSDRRQYRIGEGMLPDEFDKQLVGMKRGEEKDFSFVITSKNFLSIDVDEQMDVHLTLIDIIVPEVPTLCDEWVKENVPGAHSIESFKNLVRSNIKQQSETHYAQTINAVAASVLAKRLPDEDLPEIYYEYTRSGLLQNFSAALAKSGYEKESFYEAQGTTEQQFMVDMMMRAKDVVREGLALDSFAKHFGITIDSDDISMALNAIQAGDEDSVYKMLEMNGRLYQLREMAIRNKARKVLIEQANYVARDAVQRKVFLLFFRQKHCW